MYSYGGFGHRSWVNPSKFQCQHSHNRFGSRIFKTKTNQMKNRIDRCDVRHDGESHKSAVQITKARSASLPGRGVASLDYKLQSCIRSSKCRFMTTKHFELAAGEGMPNASEKALGNQICCKLVKSKVLAFHAAATSPLALPKLRCPADLTHSSIPI